MATIFSYTQITKLIPLFLHGFAHHFWNACYQSNEDFGKKENLQYWQL